MFFGLGSWFFFPPLFLAETSSSLCIFPLADIQSEFSVQALLSDTWHGVSRRAVSGEQQGGAKIWKYAARLPRAPTESGGLGAAGGIRED